MKKRSIFSLLTVCILMFVFSAPLLASAESEPLRAGCSHPTTSTRSRKEYLRDTETNHLYKTVTTRYCTVCNAVLSTVEGTYHSEPHSLSISYSESYHSGIRHTWVYKCPCGYTRSTTVLCSGPPCSSPMSLDDLEPCTHTDVTTDIAQKQVTDTTVQSVFTRICDDCDAILSVSTGIPREKNP